jgi:tRNA(Ile)-lysidine synthase
VLRFVRDRGVLSGGEHVLAAVSGGQDSTALLILLSRLSPELEIRISVAHFDHRLRDREEAACDEGFVKGLAERFDLPLVCGSGDVAARARRAGESVEEAARGLCYCFLARQARALGADVVLMGHTRDDRAESVLMHIVRGSGLEGLVGMRPRSAWPLGRGPRPQVARPLLRTRREETRRYCLDGGVTPRDEPTNEILIATRNRFRHELLPKLREFNPRFVEALVRLAEAVEADVDYVEEASEVEWRRLARRAEDGYYFTLEDLSVLSPALVVRLVRRAIRRTSRTEGDIELAHVSAVSDLLVRGRGRVSLAHGLVAAVDSGTLKIRRERGRALSGIPRTALNVPGVTSVGGWVIEARLVDGVPEAVGGDPLEAFLDAEAVSGGLEVRSRQAGDRLRPLGLGGEKKVQDLLVDSKVPREKRDLVPIVCAQWGVAWVVGHRIDERAALGLTSCGFVHLRFGRLESR